VFIRKLLAKPLQESEAVPESLRTIDQRVRRDAHPNFPPRNNKCETVATATNSQLCTLLKQFSSQPYAKTGIFHHPYVFHAFTAITWDSKGGMHGFRCSSKSRKL
jgi:hypothetical protein